MSKKSYVPWTLEEVYSLQIRQKREDMHPYTCLYHGSSPLIPTYSGWVCSVDFCDYNQDWAFEGDMIRYSYLRENK